jgi:hypothetical protein
MICFLFFLVEIVFILENYRLKSTKLQMKKKKIKIKIKTNTTNFSDNCSHDFISDFKKYIKGNKTILI